MERKDARMQEDCGEATGTEILAWLALVLVAAVLAVGLLILMWVV